MAELHYKVVAGLGNPGKEYVNTRHNMGFMLVERFLAAHHPERWEKLHICDSFVYTGSLAGDRLMLVLPQTFMNESGKAVAKILRHEGLEPDALIVAHDDLDLPPGRMRLRQNGAAGGHHGIESIIEELQGRSDFARLRLGIGHGQDTIDHVLGAFTAEETPAITACLDAAVKALELALRRGLGAAMNEFNGWSYTPPETETIENAEKAVK